MPSYGSLHSPSLRKMNGQMDNKGRRTGNMRTVSLENILGDPFALASLSIASLAWLISFVGSIVASSSNLDTAFPNYSWFSNAFMLCLIVGIFVVIASDTIQTYHVALVGFLAVGLVLTSSSVNSLIYSDNGAKEATAAGNILLSMVNVSESNPQLDKYGINVNRLSGSSTLAQPPLQPLAHTSTPSLSTKNTEALLADEDQQAVMATVDPIHPSPPMFRPKCILPLN